MTILNSIDIFGLRLYTGRVLTVLAVLIRKEKGGDWMFEMDLRSRAPIYEQLVGKIKEMIIHHVLKADEQLPTVRVLAGELTINPNTIQKAYRELEHLGYIYSIPGKGSFVKAASPEGREARLQFLEGEMRKIVSEMIFLGMPLQEILSLIQNASPKDKGGKRND
jgi:GntR family transcriptional regulator